MKREPILPGVRCLPAKHTSPELLAARLDDNASIRAAYEAGASTEVLAMKLLCSCTCIRNRLLKAGATLRKRIRHTPPEPNAPLIAKADGELLEEIVANSRRVLEQANALRLRRRAPPVYYEALAAQVDS